MSSHRGRKPHDDQLFGPHWLPILKEAVDDLGYLLTRGYSASAALAIVGNRYQLNQRQRMAVGRMSASDQEISQRKQKECKPIALQDQAVAIDGFNLLILLESVMSGAYIFKGRDGTYRDIASVHGSYKRVIQTEEAIPLAGDTLKALKVSAVRWVLDSPVSYSGQLKEFLYKLSEENGYHWEVTLIHNPDIVLAESQQIVISSDGWILDRVARWFNLGAYLIENKLPQAQTISV